MQKMQDDFVSKLLTAFSSERIEAYRNRINGDENNDLFVHYAWNIALSESLYPSIQILEIVLRNSINRAMSQEFGRVDWYDAENIITLRERDKVNKAKKSLAVMGKPIEAGRVVAELSFGFWTALMDRRYEQVLWRKLIKPCFPYMPRHLRTRKNILGRFEKIRRLRNRIFHHEPIWFWENLENQHKDILEAISWIEPAARDFVTIIDRFPSVYKTGQTTIENELKRLTR